MIILYITIKIILNQNPSSQELTEKAIYIIDGDTFETSDGEIIRLLCVDTPEKNENGYEEAKGFLSSYILNKDISIEIEGIDSYNRTLAWVSVKNDKEIVLINKEIVKNGFGTLFEYNGTNCERMR